MNAIDQLSHTQEVSSKVAQLLQKRVSLAQERYKERVQKVLSDAAADFKQRPLTPWEAMIGWYNYSVDFAQRSVLFWDTLRQRGNNFVEHERQGCRRCCTSTTKWCSTGARSSARSTTRWCASCRRQA